MFPEISDEEDRLLFPYEYRISGAHPEQCYDDITKIASLICGTPIFLMSFVDANKQWLKSRYGFDTAEKIKRCFFLCSCNCESGTFNC